MKRVPFGPSFRFTGVSPVCTLQGPQDPPTRTDPLSVWGWAEVVPTPPLEESDLQRSLCSVDAFRRPLSPLVPAWKRPG